MVTSRGRWVSLLVVLLLLVVFVAGNAPSPGVDSGAVESDAEPSGENEAVLEAAIEAAIEALEEEVVDDVASGGAESDADREEEVDVEDVKEQLVDHLKKAMESGKVKVFVKSEIKAKQAAVPLESFNGDKLDDSFERENHFVVGVSSSAGGPDDTECGAHERKVYVTNYEGMRLECIVPVVEREDGEKAEGDNGDGDTAPDADLADRGDLASAPSHEERVRELAGDLLGKDTLNNCHRKVDGWWTYEICPMAHVRQYHEENLKILSSFELGSIDWEQTREALEDKGRVSKAVTFFYNQGTKCDLNGMERSTVVSFTCSSDNKDAVVSVTETASCKYAVEIESKELCKHQDFQQKRERIHQIRCHPVATVSEEIDPEVAAAAAA